MDFIALPSLGLFKRSTYYMASKYISDSASPTWSFIVIIPILLVISIWHIYGILILLKKRNIFLTQPPIIPRKTYLFCIIVSILHMFAIYLQNKNIILGSLVLFFAMMIILLICLIYSLKKFKVFKDVNNNIAEVNGHVKFVTLTMYTGLPLYTAWVFWITTLNFGIALKKYEQWESYQASQLCIAILFLGLLIFALLDFFVLQKCSRWIIAVYLLFMWIAIGMLCYQHSMVHIKIAILSMAIVLSLFKFSYGIMYVINSRHIHPVYNYSLYNYVSKNKPNNKNEDNERNNVSTT